MSDPTETIALMHQLPALSIRQPWASSIVLDDVREVSFVPCRGSLGFFRAES